MSDCARTGGDYRNRRDYMDERRDYDYESGDYARNRRDYDMRGGIDYAMQDMRRRGDYNYVPDYAGDVNDYGYTPYHHTSYPDYASGSLSNDEIHRWKKKLYS